MMIDPDKLVEKEKRLVLSVYQSKGQPQHFEDEGQEFIDETSNRINDENTLSKALNLSLIFSHRIVQWEK